MLDVLSFKDVFEVLQNVFVWVFPVSVLLSLTPSAAICVYIARVIN